MQKNKSPKKKKVNKKTEEYRSKISDIISNNIDEGLSSSDTEITIFTGGTNSGKTHHAIMDLKTCKNGCYLGPLRLLAWEIYHRLNFDGVYCNLITGEEKIYVDFSTVSACTVEMYNPNIDYDVVICDEMQLVNSIDRGWAFSRVILHCKAKKLHIISAPESLDLIKSILDRLGKTYSIKYYERLVPLKVADKPDILSAPTDKTIYVSFSRLECLELKGYFEKLGKKVSVLYGNLPPEVRKTQIQKFINGETDIICATDCIGMGINSPCDRIVLCKLEKFNGQEVVRLTKSEVRQIAGRAGRYGISQIGYGEVGATTQEDLDYIRWCLESEPEVYKKAKIAPEIEELLVFPEKRLSTKLIKWSNINPVPENLRDLISQVDLSPQIELASAFDQESQDIIGIENVFQLIRCPVKKDKNYWLECCRSILNNIPLPIPEKKDEIHSQEDLLFVEQLINDCEVYQWIYNCTKFKELCVDLEEVKKIKEDLIAKIDQFLLKTRSSKVNKLIKKQVKLLEQQEDQCWQEYVVIDSKKKGNK